VISITVGLCINARALFDALGAALPSNSTLRHLDLNDDDPNCLPAVFLALEENTGLKTLSLDVGNSVDESLCTAIHDGLGTNETLESLELDRVRLCDDTTLKTFIIYLDGSLRLTDNEDNQIAALPKKNYAMDSLPEINLENEFGDVSAILRLNRSGRRFPSQKASKC
jgi:hypothetical protein